ncbi:MAG TPA: hypothetical protein VKT82_10250 [Ktedonobacterales bacterium]|nr:hypothetical protein [Ktedonobacterales bacterium]
MFGRIWWRVAGLLFLLVGLGGMPVLVNTVIIPLVHTALMPHIGPLMAPICPGAPECG